jgi:hypothetical protein
MGKKPGGFGAPAGEDILFIRDDWGGAYYFACLFDDGVFPPEMFLRL